MITTAAAGLAFSGEFFPALAKARKADPAFVDPTKIRPRPRIRVEAAILEQPRPYWLGWPGKTYALDQRQKSIARNWLAPASAWASNSTRNQNQSKTTQRCPHF
jgi:hypothetical protein